MKTFIVNLGLNNNPFTEKECIELLKGGHLSPLVDFTDFVTHMGEYENKAEPTLVMKMIVNSSAGEIITARSVVQSMCTKFTHQCIPMREEGANEGDGVLIWNEALTEGPYTFDPAFLIDPYRKPSSADGYAIFCVAQWLGHIEDLDARWEEAKKCYDEFIRSEYNDMSRPELQGINEFMDNRTRKLEKPSGKYKFPRRCDITGIGMWYGYCFGDGQDYAINKSGASTIAAQYGYETLEEAWEDDAYYFTEWQELDEEDGWYESDYEDGRDAVWVDAE